jgi:hypothetical protein
MNLKENINRIKEVMGINESKISPYTKRRFFDMLPDFIRHQYKWLAPWSFNTYDQYISRVIFGVFREISSSLDGVTYEEMMKIREKIEPIIREYIIDNFSDEIEEYYVNNL